MGYTTFTTYQLSSLENSCCFPPFSDSKSWFFHRSVIRSELLNYHINWLNPDFLHHQQDSAPQVPRSNLPRIGSQSVPWKLPTSSVFPQKKMDGWKSPKDLRKLEFWEEKKAQQVFCLGENVSNMCFYRNVSPKICKIFRCCNKIAARICLGSGQEGSEFYYSKILEELHLFPEISDVFFHKSRYRPTGQGWACTKQRVNKNPVKVAGFTSIIYLPTLIP